MNDVTIYPVGTRAWVNAGRYRGLKVTRLDFLPSLAHGGFYRCAILMREIERGEVVDLVPRGFVTQIPPWQWESQ